MNKKTLGLVMVVKDEGLGLERAIKSALPFVDEVIIAVDNASSDNTLEIAKKYAHVVKTFDWRDDFAWARNFAHAGAKSDWLIFLDGHEYIEKCERLQEYLNSPADSLLCTVSIENGSEIRNPRIYKNGIQFHGAVHELQKCKNTMNYPFILIKHARVGGQSESAIAFRDKQRNDQIPRIMGEELKHNPKNIRASFHLALHAQAIGDFRQAIKYQKLYFKHSKLPAERWFVYFNRALCHLALGNNFRAFWACYKADEEQPNRWEVRKLMGLVYFQARKYERALVEFVASFDNNKCDQPYKPWKRDDSGTFNLIGECFFHLRDHYKSNVAFNRASELATDEKAKELFKKRADFMLIMAKR